MRTYTIEFMRFNGVYYPTLYKVVVSANNLSGAIQEALLKYEGIFDEEELEWAKESLISDDYDTMLGTKSNEWIALLYNNVLDCIRHSDYRLLKGYCGKRKCFDIVIQDKYSEVGKEWTKW